MKISKQLTMSGLATVFGAWLHTGFADQSYFPLDPLSDPTKPSNKRLIVPIPGTDDKSKNGSLKLPDKPKQGSDGQSAKGPRIHVEKVVFDFKDCNNEDPANEDCKNASTIFSNEDLEQVTNPFLERLNHQLSGSDLEQLRYQLTLFYVDKGYISSGAVIEKQSFKDGILHIKIVEGKLTDVKVSGNGWLREEYIQDRLKGDTDEPLNTKDLQERYTRLLNDPLIDRLNGTLLPGLKPGDAVLDLKVTRKRNYGLTLSADNFAPPSIGGYAGRIDTWVSNLSGFGEILNFSFNEMGGAQNYIAGVDVPLNSAGTRFAFHYSNVNTVLVEAPFAQLDIKSNIINYDAQFMHPFYLPPNFLPGNQILTVGFNFNIRQNYTTLSGQPLDRPGSNNGQDSETVVRLWQDYVYQSPSGALALDLRSTESVGLDIFGANKTTQVGDGRFFDWLLQIGSRYTLSPNMLLPNGGYIAVNGALQLADDQLLPLEQLAIGGFSTVKGYRQNYLVRDEGFYTALEFHYSVFGGTPGTPYGVFLVPFVNYGGAWNYRQAGTNLFSSGIGIEGNYGWIGIDGAFEMLSASLYWAERLTSYTLTPGTPKDLQDDGVNFQVKCQVF
ncbi:MAG: hypothetical protein DM484_25985 [Candidatus Methylumidiphilus alinenensis]|uniref:ShlB/FhaC/HecB family hemolysin secretion/activation protein n=1 Tax=Candidatus Methylumidiphilus alinenensis TaxID=2202197 RepID=A0A2W4QHD0_9GAMM|nr:MAG: hypothetical protein DM484_25985 [Candidatus Methylumidiphilus alinenensis]